MKKLTTTIVAGACLLGAVAASYGQGQLQFQNNTGTSPVTYGTGTSTSGERTFGAAGTYEYGLYVGAAGATDISQLTLIDTSLSPGATSATTAFSGYINGGTVTGQGNVGAANGFSGLVAGNTYSVEVAVWTHADGASYAAASQSSDPNLLVGHSAIGSAVPSASPSPVTQLFGTGAGQLGGIAINPIAPTPEPATIALSGLGAAGLLLLRRRRK